MQIIKEVKGTVWFNPTPHTQTVTVHHGEGRHASTTTYTIEPGQTGEIPSMYDGAINIVADCHQKGCQGICRKGHSGKVIGGLAPLLQKQGSTSSLDAALVPSFDKPGTTPMSVAPADVAGRIAAVNATDGEDPILARARARRAGGAQ